jgi:hypothetical protein
MVYKEYFVILIVFVNIEMSFFYNNKSIFMLIRKKEQNGRVNFLSEVQANLRDRYKKDSKTHCWAAIITNYKTSTDFQRNFFEFKCSEISIKNIKAGNVLNIRDEKFVDSNSCVICNIFYLILEINDGEVILENCKTIAKAVKKQRSIATTSNFVPIPNKQI